MANMKAVQFDHYGDIDVLEVRYIPRPSPGTGEVLVAVKAAGINPGETVIRRGAPPVKLPSSQGAGLGGVSSSVNLVSVLPHTLPSGQGADLAGVVVEVGPGVETFTVGEEVLGFCPRSKRVSQAEFVVVPANNLTLKPSAVSWEVAGALFTAGTAAYAAVRAVGLAAGDTVAVSAAAGGVGTIAVQLAKRAGARVLGIAGSSNDDWLSAHGVIPVNYGDNLSDRLRAAAPQGRVDAFLDFFGGNYVKLAVTDLGVPPQRVNTIIDFAAAMTFGVKAVSHIDAANVGVLAELATLIANGDLEIPIAAVYPLDEVRQAFRTLEQRHTRGKIVLRP